MPAGGVPLGGALALALATSAPPVDAADHLEPPGRTNKDVDDTPDVPADIADVFAFVRGDQVILAMTFAGPGDKTNPGVYDRDMLYRLNVSTQDPATTPEYVIKWRYGFGSKPNQVGVRIEGLPGVDGVIEGSVETELKKDGVTALAGLFDDPFFFDSRGFRESRATGDIRFNNQRDFFAGHNDTALVLSIPKSRFNGAQLPIHVWGTSSRLGGNK